MNVDPLRNWRKIALVSAYRWVAGMIEEFRTNHRNVGPPHRSMLTVDSYPTSGRPFYSGGDVIAQFLRSLQCSPDPARAPLE
jgi:hypothetical protein